MKTCAFCFEEIQDTCDIKEHTIVGPFDVCFDCAMDGLVEKFKNIKLHESVDDRAVDQLSWKLEDMKLRASGDKCASGNKPQHKVRKLIKKTKLGWLNDFKAI